MAAENHHISQAVDVALEQIKRNAPSEFSKLIGDAKVKDAIIEAARAAAAEQIKLAHEFNSRPDQNIREGLAKHLPQDRIKLIERALRIPTFRMEFTQRSNGKHCVYLTREGEEFLPERELATVADTEWACRLQEASILVEAVLFVMHAVGIELSPSDGAVKVVIKETVGAIEDSKDLQRAIEKFTTSWQAAAERNAWERAKAIFVLVKDLDAAEFMWKIIKSLCREMKWYDWVLTAAKMTAMIIAACATDGVALIAKIALIVLDAVEFAKDVTNLLKLKEIKQTL